MSISDEQLTRSFFEGKTIAVVGNGPEAGFGPDNINSFDYVVRFNRFRLGREFSHVGTKHNVFAVPTACLWAFPPRDRIKDIPVFIDAAPVQSGDYSKGLDRLNEASPDAAIIRIDSDFHRSLAKELAVKRATTGLATVAWLLKHAKASNIYLTGFSCKKQSEDHYFKDRNDRFDYRVHCPVKEGFWLARHHKDLVWDYHMRDILESDQPCDEVANAERRGWADYSKPHRDVYHSISERLTNGLSVVEIGGGIGWGAETMKEAGANVDLIIEPHPRAKRHLEKLGWTVVEQIDSVDSFFDVAACVEVLEHLPAIAVSEFLKSITSIARRAFFSTPDRRESNHGRRTELEWKTEFELAGWHVVKITKIKWTMLFEVVAKEITA